MSRKKKKKAAQSAAELSGGADFSFDETVAAVWQDYYAEGLQEGEEYYIPDEQVDDFEDTDFAPENKDAFFDGVNFEPESSAYPEETDFAPEPDKEFHAEAEYEPDTAASVPDEPYGDELPAAEDAPGSADEAEKAEEDKQPDTQSLIDTPTEITEDELPDEEEEKKTYASIKPVPGSYPYLPYESVRERLFGRSRFFAVFSSLTGIYAAFWNALYYVLLIQRAVLFKNAEAAMAARGNMNYTILFVSPLQDALRVMLYILPVLLLIWVASLVFADKKEYGYGSVKMVIAVLVLVCVVGFTMLLDLGIAGLVFDVIRQ